MYTHQLLDFLGKKTEFYTNAGSVHQPHDNPGQVTLNTHLHTDYGSICFIAVNTDYLLLIEQGWNYAGE